MTGRNDRSDKINNAGRTGTARSLILSHACTLRTVPHQVVGPWPTSGRALADRPRIMNRQTDAVFEEAKSGPKKPRRIM
jgi:hypothetical protein